MKISSVDYFASAFTPEQFPSASLPEIAFVGRSNVGKSSLLNALAGRKKLAHTSSSPGKTRTVNFFIVNGKFYLVDLPGYGFARVGGDIKRQWQKLIEAYLRERETLRLVVLLMDIRHPPTDDDRAMYRWLVHFNIPTVIVATKADKISRGRFPAHTGQIRQGLGLGQEGPVILFSTESTQGRDELWQRINQYL